MVLPERILATTAVAECQEEEDNKHPNPHQDPAPDGQSSILLLVPVSSGEKEMKHTEADV